VGCVEPGAHRGAAGGEPVQLALGSRDARGRGVELSSPSRPFLTDRQRHCVLEVSAADLDHVVPLLCLGGDGLLQCTHLG
jgi:hypothetical protein